ARGRGTRCRTRAHLGAPPLDAILRVCRAAAFRLRDVLLGDLDAVRAGEAPPAAPYVSPPTETHRFLDEAVMERILRAALTADPPPPTLASIYADTRVNSTHVRRRSGARRSSRRGGATRPSSGGSRGTDAGPRAPVT
ncbi:MAG: hypothetical protein WCH74_12245, partial [Chloroflexota bacterium]